MHLERWSLVASLSLSVAACSSSEGGSGGGGAGATGTDAAAGPGAGNTTGAHGSTSTAQSGSTASTSSGPTGGGALGGCTLFPADSPWNTPIDTLPVHPSSADYIDAIGGSAPVHPDFGAPYDGAPNGIPFVVVPADQPMVPITFDTDDESDPGPYPIPPGAPIEGGPDGDGDRHVLVVQQSSCVLYESYAAYPDGDAWEAGSGAVWHLDANEVRPDGWTSADAAGLPVLPGLVRYDEVVEAGHIDHALRVTVSSAQSAYMHPATHSDGPAGHDASHPPMGLRLRLKASFDASELSSEAQVIAAAMKKYGLVVADTGGDWYVSGAPDDRWNDSALQDLAQISGDDFEAVDTGEDIHPYQ